MRVLIALLLVTFCCAMTPHKHRQRRIQRHRAEGIDVRLPTHLRPVQYDIQLKALFDEEHTIEGYVSMEIMCYEPSNNITVNILDIQILNAQVLDSNNNEMAISSTGTDEERQFYIVYVEEQLQSGSSYRVNLQFKGILNNELAGFYRSTYTDENGETQMIAASQMQATDARRAFPCFDEPDFKAIFNISLARMANMTSASNMDIASSVPEEGNELWVWDHYTPSKEMSTYLVALVVSDFEAKQYDYDAKWKMRNIIFSIHAQPAAIAAGKTDYAGHIGPQILSFLEDFYQIEYPLPKCDMISLPDFAAGGMENWGLIAYRESRFLYDPSLSGVTTRRTISAIVSHELAHMWFGDLVTPSWWEDLWLNEGFASYVEYFGTDHVEPTWNVLDEVANNELQYAMQLDGLESSHPISQPVNHPDEINELFDAISYSKGASIIRMMDFFLTRKTFQKGVSNYLKAFEYSNAHRDDLWEHLTRQAHQDGTLSEDLDVKEIMDTWALQMGYPVVTVKRTEDGTSATVSQKRFLLTSADSEKKDDHEYSWWVPITHTNAADKDFSVDNTRPSVWLPKDQQSIEIENVAQSKDDWVVMNIQETGYYRVNYEEDNWQLLAAQLQQDHSAIPPVQRSQLLDDALNLARAGELVYDVALSLTQYLHKEDDYFPLDAAFTAFNYINLMMERTDGYQQFQAYMKPIVDSLYEGVELVESNDLQTSYKNITIISQACKYDNQQCISYQVQEFQNFRDKYDEKNPDNPENQITPDLKDSIYCTAIRQGGEDEWQFLWRHYELTASAAEKTTVLEALACSADVQTLERYLGYILDESSGVRTQDGARVYSNIASNPVGRPIAWDFVRNEWDSIMTIYGGGIMLIDEFIPSVTKGFNTEEELQELLAFNEKTTGNQGAAEMTFQQSIDTVEMNLRWMNNYYDYLIQIFSQIS